MHHKYRIQEIWMLWSHLKFWQKEECGTGGIGGGEEGIGEGEGGKKELYPLFTSSQPTQHYST